jgi:hypothetical protein
MEHVRSPEDRQRGQVASERPATDGHAREVEHARVGVGHAVQGVDLILQRERRQVQMDRTLPCRPAARRATAVRHDDGEALIGEPLGLQQPLERPRHAS